MSSDVPYLRPVYGGAIPDRRASAIAARHYLFGCWLVVEVDGELDMATVPVVTALLGGHPRHVVFDLTGLDFIDARGLGLLATTRNRLDPYHGCVRVAGPSPHARKLLALTGVDRQIDVFDSIGEALGGHAACW